MVPVYLSQIRIDTPIVLAGQSYGAGIISSYLADYGNEHDIRKVILTEPGPIPGSEYSNTDKKTTKAENVEGMTITDVLRSPRMILECLLPASNQFVDQEELLHFVNPELRTNQPKKPAPNFWRTGCSAKIELHAIDEITKRNTGGYAIRPFIRMYPAETLQKNE